MATFKTPPTRVTDRVSRAILDSGLSKAKVAEKTKISYRTLLRKLNDGDFTVPELLQIADVTQWNPEDFLAAALDDHAQERAA
ncbi:MAG: helix-turn-helix domain-containing protein [Microbacteriaceae bacterium]